MCYEKFPDGYTYFDKIDLKNNKKQFWLIQGLGVLLMIIMFVAGYFIAGLEFYEDYVMLIIALVVLIVGFILYIILHEATHAVVMRLSVKAKLNFGFVGWAAYAGSKGYFDKKHYILVALAPLVLWGIIFAVLNIFFHSGVWFWVIWFLQTGNVSGACGDLFCTYKMLTYPKDILVCDTGLDMTVFRRKTAEELAAERIEKRTENGEESGTENSEETLID